MEEKQAVLVVKRSDKDFQINAKLNAIEHCFVQDWWVESEEFFEGDYERVTVGYCV